MRPGTSTTRISGRTAQTRRSAAMRSALTAAGTEHGGIDRARNDGDAIGRQFVALDHGARDVSRRRDHAVAARQRAAQHVAEIGMAGQPVGKRRDQKHRLLVGGGERAPGAARALRVHDVDALARNQLRERARIGADAQRIERVVDHRQPFAAEGAQFADQRAAVAGHHGARAGLQQRERDIDRGVAGRIVAQGWHQLQDGGAGERARMARRSSQPSCVRGPLAARSVHPDREPVPHERSSPDLPDDRIAAATADHRRARARGQEPQWAPGCSGWAASSPT